MESAIRNLHAARECFAQFSADQLNSMNNDELKLVCLKERLDLIESVNLINTKELIKERLLIKQAKESEEVGKRRRYLDSNFK